MEYSDILPEDNKIFLTIIDDYSEKGFADHRHDNIIIARKKSEKKNS